MSTIFIPYALGSLKDFTFKEITKKEYDTFLGALVRQDHINKIKQQERARESAAINEKRKKFRESIPALKQSYIDAQKNRNKFYSLHSDVFSKYERLKDDEYDKLSWIIGFSSRERELKKHMAQYKHIHDQLQALEMQVRSLSRYSEDNMTETIYSKERHHENLSSESYKNIEKKWQTEIQKQSQLLYPTRGYHLLIENLQINTSGSIIEIAGNGVQIEVSRQKQQIRMSLINQKVQIIR
ncbi:MAG: hypothetical protein IJY99_01410 [Alphaproteobacteria bacterium]|nr:hypothetical protein [Alphaproteobacteria bacterium]